MEERFICIRMNHVSDLTKATMYTVDGLIKESDEILSKERGEEIKTCTDDYDMLLFWHNRIMAINKKGNRDANCQSVVCHSCNRKITSNECPVCREPNKFTLGNSSPK